MIRSPRTSAVGLAAAVLAGVAGFMAFNVFDTVFGVPEAIIGLAVWAVLTVVVFRRPSPSAEEPDA